MGAKGITATVCEFASSLKLENVPRPVVERACLLVTDSVGIAIRGRREAESTPALLAAVQRMGIDHGGGVCLLMLRVMLFRLRRWSTER